MLIVTLAWSYGTQSWSQNCFCNLNNSSALWSQISALDTFRNPAFIIYRYRKIRLTKSTRCIVFVWGRPNSTTEFQQLGPDSRYRRIYKSGLPMDSLKRFDNLVGEYFSIMMGMNRVSLTAVYREWSHRPMGEWQWATMVHRISAFVQWEYCVSLAWLTFGSFDLVHQSSKHILLGMWQGCALYKYNLKHCLGACPFRSGSFTGR